MHGYKGKMNADFFNALDLLEKENGISKEYMISQIELADGEARIARSDISRITTVFFDDEN